MNTNNNGEHEVLHKEEFKVEYGIPIPKKAKIRWETLEVGGSILIPDDGNIKSARANANKFGKDNGMKFCSRKVDGGHRIWRIA